MHRAGRTKARDLFAATRVCTRRIPVWDVSKREEGKPVKGQLRLAADWIALAEQAERIEPAQKTFRQRGETQKE